MQQSCAKPTMFLPSPHPDDAASASSTSSASILSRPMQRKLVTLVNCQLVEEEGRARAMRAVRSLGERITTELILQHQNPQQLSSHLWAAVRARGCQFLGPGMRAWMGVAILYSTRHQQGWRGHRNGLIHLSIHLFICYIFTDFWLWKGTRPYWCLVFLWFEYIF